MSDTAHVRKGRDPNFTWRGLAILAAMIAGFGGAAWWVVVDERAATECGFHPPDLPARFRNTTRHADWEWWPPGHVCIYKDDEERIVGRRRI